MSAKSSKGKRSASKMTDAEHQAMLVDLLHWDRAPGLHTTGLAQLQMWVLAAREGLLLRGGSAGDRAASGQEG